MKISDVKNAITMMQEYVRLTEIIARIQKGETIEIHDKPHHCVCTTILESNGCKSYCDAKVKYNAIKEQ
jgi:hypothetical protein